MPAWASMLIGLATVTASIIGARYAYRGNREAAEIEAQAAPYDSLAARVDKLETQVGQLRDRVETLEDEQAHDRRWMRCAIRLIRRWVPAEHHPPTPAWMTDQP